MSTMLPSVRGKSWVFQVTALCIVLGALLGLSLKTQRQVVNEGGIPNRLPALRAAFQDTKEDNVKLKKELAYYKEQSDKYAKQLAQGTPRAESLVKTMNEARIAAGMVAVRGPGVVVTLIDSPKINEAPPEDTSQYMIHATDILQLVNELFNAGAEAISINEQRVTATTSIRCGGAPVMVDTSKLQQPYKIKAIGNPDALEYTMKMRNGVADELCLTMLDMITIKKESMLYIPAYAGVTRYSYAKVVAGTDGSD